MGEETFGVRKSIYWTLAIVIITMTIFGLWMSMASYKNSLMQVLPETKAELISLRFMNNPDCFAYQDEDSGRVFPGVIDLEKFNKARLVGCYRATAEEEGKKYGFKKFGFDLKLVGEDVLLKTSERYRREDFILLKDVLVRDGGEWKKDKLEVYVYEWV